MARSKRALLVALAVVPAAVACNGIIGLNDFSYGECPGARCTDDAGFDVADVNQPDVTPEPDAGKDAGPGAQAVSWAKWPMPNYDGGKGVLPSYEDDGDTVKDKVTGLVWRKAVLPNSYGYADAAKACQTQIGADWRLPKRIELVTLVDYTQTGRATISTIFTGFPSSRIWTSSESRTYDAVHDEAVFDRANPSYWVIDFGSGKVEPYAATNALAVLCVKGGG